MAESLTQKNGTTNYTQKQIASGVDTQSGADVSQGENISSTSRDGASVTDSHSKAVERANLGFTISFTIPLIGRFPTTGAKC